MIKIMTDSSTLYTAEDGRQAGIEAIPLCISIGELNLRDMNVDMQEFYRLIEEGGVPTSSQPPIGEVMDAYEAHKGHRIINITMADGLSGTYQTACGAREMADNKEDITVFNSRTLCGPHRYMVDTAQKMAEADASYTEIMAYLELTREGIESYLMPKDFGFLRRGGRLTPLAATFGSLLKLRPIVKQTKDGCRLDRFGMGRTLKSAVESIIRQLKTKRLGAEHILYISHAEALADAQIVKAMIEKEFTGLEIRMLELSAAFVTQGGPGCIAIQYVIR